jgi:hypothetical protein
VSKKCFKETKFAPQALAMIQRADHIINEYQQQGLRMTVRQLYYQFVTRNWIVNSEKAYKGLTDLVSKARLAGLLDWEAIEDRGREALEAAEYPDLASALKRARDGFRLHRWEGQTNYVELWVEKAALAGVLMPIALKYHVTLMVNKGYSSQTAMYESSRRYLRRIRSTDGKAPLVPHLLYLGDFDPSGEDMVRDIRERMVMFRCPVHVKKVALTMKQIQQYNPPPNPAKVSDPRARRYIEEHGDTSWEVDALSPAVLTKIVSKEIFALMDKKLMSAVVRREDEAKAKLDIALKGI